MPDAHHHRGSDSLLARLLQNTHLKQYHKEGRALRTETTLNNTYDFGVGRRLHNLPKLREIGFAANRRVLEVEKVTHDCHLGTQAFQKLQQPIQVEDQRASALRFGDPRVQALLAVLVLFCLQPEGFTHEYQRLCILATEGDQPYG